MRAIAAVFAVPAALVGLADLVGTEDEQRATGLVRARLSMVAPGPYVWSRVARRKDNQALRW